MLLPTFPLMSLVRLRQRKRDQTEPDAERWRGSGLDRLGHLVEDGPWKAWRPILVYQQHVVKPNPIFSQCVHQKIQLTLIFPDYEEILANRHIFQQNCPSKRTPIVLKIPINLTRIPRNIPVWKLFMHYVRYHGKAIFASKGSHLLKTKWKYHFINFW